MSSISLRTSTVSRKPRTALVLLHLVSLERLGHFVRCNVIGMLY